MGFHAAFFKKLIKRSLCLLIPLMLFTAFVSPDNIAGLEKKLRQAPGIKKSAILNELLKTMREARLDKKQKEKVPAYAQEALEYARKFKQGDQEVYALAHIGYAYLMQQDYDRALSYAEKSLNLAEKRKNKKEILYALEVKGVIYTYIPDFKKALRICKRMRILYDKVGDKKGQARIINRISNIYTLLGEDEKLLGLKKEALRLYRDSGDYEEIAHMMADIGRIYSQSGNNEKALEYLLNGIKLAEEKGLAFRAGRINFFLGSFYHKRKKFQKAYEYYHKAIDTFKENNFTSDIVNPYIGLGNLLKEQKEYDKALFYLNRALEIILQLKVDIYSKPAGILSAIGQVYFEKKEYQKALVKYEEALDFYKKIGHNDSQARCCMRIGKVHLVRNDLKKAYENLNRSRELAEKSNHIILRKDNYQLLSDYYEKTGNYKKALEYHRMFADLNFKIYDEKSAEALTEMQTKYETEKKEKEIELLKSQEQLRELTLSKQKIIRNVSIAGFVLILIFLGFFIKKYHYFLAFWKKKNFIGRFKVVNKIGSGGMGIVFKAHDVQDKTKTFAIKVLREEYFDNDTYRKRFKHEALLTDQLDHPNIVKIIERGEAGDNLFIAMELLQGKPLDVRLQEPGQLNLKECYFIMIQVTDALVLIHSKNIIHRDLKPSNIMLIEKDGEKNFVKLLDFGLARADFQTRLTRTGIMVGTTSYLSPEQITNTGINTASDIFSLGIIFYEMVCGSKPFFGESESDIIRAILDAAPVEPNRFRREIPAKLNELIMKMLTKDKVSRPTSKEILAALKTINK